MNYLDHEQLYQGLWLEKERGLYQFIYENRIQCLIHELLNGSNQLIDVDKRSIAKAMCFIFDHFMMNKSAKSFAVMYSQFAPLLDKLMEQSRRPSGCYLFFFCIQWTEKKQKQAEMVSKLVETIGKLASALRPLEPACLGSQQSKASA